MFVYISPSKILILLRKIKSKINYNKFAPLGSFKKGLELSKPKVVGSDVFISQTLAPIYLASKSSIIKILILKVNKDPPVWSEIDWRPCSC